jgi:hypothetical protein
MRPRIAVAQAEGLCGCSNVDVRALSCSLVLEASPLSLARPRFLARTMAVSAPATRAVLFPFGNADCE